jgi:redox-sensitive transcriptional activator SoxR
VRVGEVAERAGVNVETLRYYERRGLLPAPDRTPSGHRRYDEKTVRFLGAIKEAQAVGFTLAEIAEYLRAARPSGAPSEALRVRMAAKIDQIDARIAALRRMRDELARVVGCACTSLDHCTCGAAYLARRGGGRQQALLSPLARRDRQLLEALRDNLQVVLWFEHDLYDQLQLLDVLALAHTEEAAPELIVIGSFPGKPTFAGLGELTARELETLWPSRRRAAPAALGVATSAWAALQAPEPTTLTQWATHESAQLPFVATALRRLLEELPAPADGLSGRNDGRSKRSPPARAHLPPPSLQHNGSRRLPSSATPGSTELSPRSGRERRGSSRPRPAHHFPRRLRSATASPSHDSSCG